MGNQYNREILDILNIAKDEGIAYHLQYRTLRMPHVLAAQQLDIHSGMIHTIRIDVTPDTKQLIEDICNRLCNIGDIHIQCINHYTGTLHCQGYTIDELHDTYAHKPNARLVMRMLPTLHYESYVAQRYNTVHIAAYKDLCILFSNNFLPVSKNSDNKIVKTEFLNRDLVTGSRASIFNLHTRLYVGRVIGKNMSYQEIDHTIFNHKYTIDIAPFGTIPK